jgi:hypothetical protein
MYILFTMELPTSVSSWLTQNPYPGVYAGITKRALKRDYLHHVESYHSEWKLPTSNLTNAFFDH